ncbi:MAG: D-tyrosyl-tRNA(Tyr) deacylase [Clostridia bacterium]|nr:D-tyrosyl-tRNA(Tyr) deacylase [Clostridia bacterium]
MRAVVQRVKNASVTVDGKVVSSIGNGFLVLLGVENGDTQQDIDYIVSKITGLRIFEDSDEKMNLSIMDVKGEIIVVSQFTLAGDARKGRRPSFSNAMLPDKANQMYMQLVESIKSFGINVGTGIFGAMMDVELINSGPVTILLDSRRTF